MSVLTDLLDFVANLPPSLLLLVPFSYLAVGLVQVLRRQERRGEPLGSAQPRLSFEEDDEEDYYYEQPPTRVRVVSTGFAQTWASEDPLPADLPLEGGRYLFWLAVGPSALPGNIDDLAAPLMLPDDASAGEVIHVVLFDYRGELGVTPGADVGRLILRADGGMDVKQPTHEFRSDDRLLFPVHVPETPGIYRLRCNIYCRNTLLQSRVVQVTVALAGVRQRDALRTTLDYVTDSTLDPAALARIPPLRLSVFANSNDDGTHSFRFFGESTVKATTMVSAGEVEEFLGRVRRTLSWVAWGNTEGWQEGTPFKYLNPGHTPTFESDLKELALAGYLMWTAVIGGVAATADGLPEDDDNSPILALQEVMRRPGLVEFANKVKASYTVPAALLYDFDLDTGVPWPSWRVCEHALAAIDAQADLASHACFRGETTHAETVVCPAGFWGFRHGVTLPQSIGGGSTKPYIEVADDLRAILGVADVFIGPHTAWVLEVLKGLGSVAGFQDRDQLLSALRDRHRSPHFVYFYCHGTEANGVPALQVGSEESAGIDYAQLSNGKVFWKGSRPLVFLNGCRTAAVQPKYAMNFVEAFIQRARASGVIGTEIITDESLGARFGQHFLENFLILRAPVADAMRSARLSLLTERDPLGMAFVAYAPPQLRLVRHDDSCPCGSRRIFGACCADLA
ncbi:CHAT domain-containing protein [Actinoplanes sp. NPDC051346]|uniref:CHAT domain-containing protein n=1 Tax=Actinoplanes sp. NPDC051346 TaxID=3155048 RepID=UPI003416CD4B